jgi:3D (Asp-Asp-Asp) domain-containing protein
MLSVVIKRAAPRSSVRSAAPVLALSLICPVVIIGWQLYRGEPAQGAPTMSAVPTSKMAKEGIAVQPTVQLRGKDKRCCGYPLTEDLGFALRFYWLALETESDDPDERKFAPPDQVEIYTRDGFFIGAVPEKMAWSMRMEGTGIMADGRVINYHGPCNFGYGTCFATLDPNEHPFGRGAGQRALVPFKSVAVDQRLVKIGEPLYIPEFDGIRLPDGSIHDGCVRAEDTGGGIKKRKMDFFVVTYANFRYLLTELWGVSYITPHVMAPKCEYLRDLP